MAKTCCPAKGRGSGRKSYFGVERALVGRNRFVVLVNRISSRGISLLDPIDAVTANLLRNQI
jgi:hypothetical protein